LQEVGGDTVIEANALVIVVSSSSAELEATMIPADRG